jgi:hypothetical protein
VIGEIYRVRLELFADLVGYLVLGTTVGEVGLVEHVGECVVVGIAKRTVRDGHG